MPLVLAAPLPIVIIHEWTARLSAVTPKTFPQGHPPATPSLPIATDTKSSVSMIDNRPYAPSDAVDPAEVLATPRPIVTSYLMELGFLSSKKGSKTADNAAKVEVDPAAILASIHDTARKLGAKGALLSEPPASDASRKDVSAVDIERPAAYQEHPIADPEEHVGIPYCVLVRGDHDEIVVISLVVVFLLVVAIVEFQDKDDDKNSKNSRQSTHDDAKVAPVGSIRLADDKQHFDQEKMPLSVQAAPFGNAAHDEESA